MNQMPEAEDNPLGSIFRLGLVGGYFNTNRKVKKEEKKIAKKEVIVPENDGPDYRFTVEPDEDSSEIDVFVKDAEGYIGSFTAKINRAISENKDFDIVTIQYPAQNNWSERPVVLCGVLNSNR